MSHPKTTLKKKQAIIDMKVLNNNCSVLSLTYMSAESHHFV